MLVISRTSQKLQMGAVMVEFAIILPLLLLLVLGIIEFGYAFYHLNILNKSVEDGARYFSSSRIARHNGIGTIDLDTLTNGTNIANAQNLVIYGGINNTGKALMPLPDGSNYSPAPTINCVNSSGQTLLCTDNSNPQHIKLTATYIHDLILGNALKSFTGGLIASSYSLTASSIMRVE